MGTERSFESFVTTWRDVDGLERQEALRTVWVVAVNYGHEGWSQPMGVYTSQERAEAAAYRVGKDMTAPEVVAVRLNADAIEPWGEHDA